MADTLPDIKLLGTSWIDVYAATGIPVGTPLIIQNKTAPSIYVQVRSTQPVATSKDGVLITDNLSWIVDGTSISGVWVIGQGLMNVQIFE